MSSDNLVLLVFNSVGLLLSVAAVALIVHLAVKLSHDSKKSFYSLLRGFGLIGFSFFWTLFFGQLINPSRLLTVQSVLLSIGMAFLIHSANKLYDLYERAKMMPSSSKSKKKRR